MKICVCVWLYFSVCLSVSGYMQQSADSHIVDPAYNSSSEATETQQATCQIVTEKLVATASATVTHALKGVCATKDLDQNFMNLRNEVNSQLSAIHLELSELRVQMDNLKELFSEKNKENANYNQSHQTLPRGPRDFEVFHLNNTIHYNERREKLFSYYWRLEDIRIKLTQQSQQVDFRSTSLYVNQTYRMFIKLFLDKEKGNIYIHVGLTQGEFDNLLPWPFTLKHRVTVLDQTYGKAEDLASRVWDPVMLCGSSDWQQPIGGKDNEQCVGFGFNQDTIFTHNFIYNNSILVRLDVFLTE